MDYVIIGFLAAAFGVCVTLFAHMLVRRRKDQKNEAE